MKSTGIVRKFDQLGRIVTPIELRRTLEIEPGDAVEIYTESDCIVLRKYHPACYFCNSEVDVSEFEGKNICAACLKSLIELA